jgi:hypothetical protein
MSSAKVEIRPNLYDPARPELKQVRERVQAHNRQAIARGWSSLEGLALIEDDLVVADLPELIVNAPQPVPEENERYQLRLNIEIFDEESVYCDLAIFDTVQCFSLASRVWSFTDVGQPGQPVRIESYSDTCAGYEGNGFGGALLGLTNAVIEKILVDLLEPRLEANPALADQAVYAVITDQAKVQSKINGPDKRQSWTTQSVQKYLPNYTSDPFRTEAELGFLPHKCEGRPEFVAVYRSPGWKKSR